MYITYFFLTTICNILSIILNKNKLAFFFLLFLFAMNIYIFFYYYFFYQNNEILFFLINYIFISNLLLFIFIFFGNAYKRLIYENKILLSKKLKTIRINSSSYSKNNYFISFIYLSVFLTIFFLNFDFDSSWNDLREYNFSYLIPLMYIFFFISFSYFYSLHVNVFSKLFIIVFFLFLSLIFKGKLVVVVLGCFLFVDLIRKFENTTKLNKINNYFFFPVFIFLIYFMSSYIRHKGFENIFNIPMYLEYLEMFSFEKNLIKSNYAVFDHYFSNQIDRIYAQSFLRLITLPLDKILNTGFLIENINYYYAIITDSNVENLTRRPTNHPSVYASSFAEYNFFGTFYLLFSYLVIIYLSKIRFKFVQIKHFITFGLIFFILLTLRGNLYYSYIFLILFLISAFLFNMVNINKVKRV